MSSLNYIASDKPLPPIDAGQERYRGAVAIHSFDKATILDEIYTEKQYCAHLGWEYTDQRAKQLLQYLTEQLRQVDALELWQIWLGGIIEEDKKETRPKRKAARTREVSDDDWDDWKQNRVHKRVITINQLTAEELKAFYFGDRLTQNCLIVKQDEQ